MSQIAMLAILNLLAAAPAQEVIEYFDETSEQETVCYNDEETSDVVVYEDLDNEEYPTEEIVFEGDEDFNDDLAFLEQD